MTNRLRPPLPPVIWLALLLLLLLLAVCFTWWYYTPLQRSAEIEVFDQTGETATVRLEISLRRSFFHPADVEGTLDFQGKTYRNLGTREYGFWSGLLKKLKQEPLMTVFANAANYNGGGEILSDLIHVQALTFGRNYEPQEISLIDGTVWWFSAELLPEN